MVFKPIFNLRSTTIRNAFILNAIVLAIISTTSIELRSYLDIISDTKGLSNTVKLLITFLGTFFIGLIIYIITRLLFGFGEGLLANSPFSKKLF
jgi:hypothetical protein